MAADIVFEVLNGATISRFRSIAEARSLFFTMELEAYAAFLMIIGSIFKKGGDLIITEEIVESRVKAFTP